MKKFTSSFGTGAIALVFAVLGYQTALLIHRSATAMIVANRDKPDTIYVYSPPESRDGGYCSRHNSAHSQKAMQIRRKVPPVKVENFRFDPNNCSEEDLIRLGFSGKQAASIMNYRKKGGRFRRKEDFAKSYVVSDSIYARLESYIDIPKIDLNKADSATFDLLPGIGGWYAKKMREYRIRLGGYSYPEQLMDIRGLDEEKFEALRDLICIDEPYRYPLWEMSADSLARHPYIKNRETARSIVFYREHNPKEKWTVEGLLRAGLISPEIAKKLELCCRTIHAD